MGGGGIGGGPLRFPGGYLKVTAEKSPGRRILSGPFAFRQKVVENTTESGEEKILQKREELAQQKVAGVETIETCLSHFSLEC